ncbi:cell wall metabolism sensor histidine kinase WalK [Desemzia sp. RIT804]|uniref:cell wall metabolism sensor histidine kinase WalK n=1 Tax=Desemzia sp. RIT 804 TaxID=2810209 RepID=UPI001950AB59|nr:cell wall metabolism sensor histidine kinase WalK [Desemzia sp. RIT 804]MBM6615844.1 cell wall metabolism sensor histidine kinase WalK [Desemzia sp. RIT 804]
MKKRIQFFQSINFKIVLIFILLLTITLEIIGANFVTQLENQLVDNFKEDRRIQVDFLENTLQPILLDEENNDKKASIANLLRDFSGSGVVEVQVVDPEYYIIGTSDNTQQSLIGRKSTDSDVHQSLLLGNNVTSQYLDPLTNDRRWKLVSPIYAEDSTDNLGVIMLETNIETIYEQVNEISVIFINSALIAIVLVIILAQFVSRAITKPISEMKQQTIQIAEGDYSGQLKVYGEDELGQLSNAINELSTRVEEAQETTEAERRRLNSVLSHMTDGVIATDRRGKVVIINEKAQEMLSISQEIAFGKSIIEILNQEMTLRQLLELEEELLFDFSTNENQVILRGGFSLIQRESGFISGLVCVLHDVTEQEKIERERKEFVSNVSHELRTPLTSMRSYLEALNDGAWKDEEIAPQFLKVTQEETNRMIRMVQDLLELSRMDSGKSNLQLELINLNELFHHVLDRFEMMLKNNTDEPLKNYSIEREITDQEIWVEIDADRIMQVLDNILNNAFKYSPDGGIITCRLVKTHNSVILSISDEGMGIPKKDLLHVFDRFFRVDKARARSMGGTGLGLAISKEVVQHHGGKIWADSTEGKGTTFYISLPYVPYEEGEWE